MRESDLNARTQEIKTREEQVHQQEAGLVSSRYNLSQVALRLALRRHRHPPQHRRRRERGRRHDEQRRHGAADRGRHVGDRGRGRGRRDRHPAGGDRPEGDRHHRRHRRQDLPRPGHRDRQQPDPAATGQAPPAPARAPPPTSRSTITLDAAVPEIRPGFTCTADISTASESNVVAVPIQALTVRELEYDKAGAVVPKLRPPPASRWSFGRPAETAATAPTELPVGHTRKEVEGVFVSRTARRRSCRSRSASPGSGTSRC